MGWEGGGGDGDGIEPYTEFVPPICQLSLHCKTTNGDIADVDRHNSYPDSTQLFTFEKVLRNFSL
jgi:hypothetical protein